MTDSGDFALRLAAVFGENPLTSMGLVAAAMAHPEWGQAVARYYRELMDIRDELAAADHDDVLVAALPVKLVS